MRKTKPVRRYNPKTISRWGTISLACDLLSFILLIGVFGAVAALPPDAAGVVLLVGGILFLIVFLLGIVATNRVLYCGWAQIQDSGTGVSPFMAVALNFIPLVNIFWVYVSFAGLARRMNTYMDLRGIEGPRAPRGRCLTACVLMSCGIIPGLGPLAALVGVIFFLVGLVGIANTAAAIAASPAVALCSTTRPRTRRAVRPDDMDAPLGEPAVEAVYVESEPERPRRRRARKSGPFDEPEKV